MRIKLIDIIQSENAILHQFGMKAFEEVSRILSSEDSVEVSFEGIRNVTSGFCNAFVGNIYKAFPATTLATRFRIINLEDAYWQEKVDNAISLAVNPEAEKKLNEAIADLFA